MISVLVAWFGAFAFVVAAFAVAPAEAAQRDDWMQFRGPNNGVSASEGLPAEWSDQQNIQWKTRLPGAGSSSPIVVGDRVFVTCYSGYGLPGDDGEDPGDIEKLTRHLLCLRLEDGGLLWKADVPAATPESKYETFVDTHGYASSTPCSDGERVYCFFGRSGVFAYDLDGNQIWQADVGEGRSGWGSSASPILWNDTLLVNASIESQTLFAFNKADGGVKWRFEKVRDAWNTPALIAADGRTQAVLNDRGELLSVDVGSGKELWRLPAGTSFFCATALAADGVVFATPKNDPLLAVRAGGRPANADDDRVLWKSQGNADIASPVLHDGRIYWVSNLVYCADAATGELLGRRRLPDGGRVFSSPLAVDGKLYVQTRLRGTYVFTLDPALELLAHNRLNEGVEDVVQSSPVVAGKSLLLRSDQYLWRLEE